MKERKHIWFLLGLQPAEMRLDVLERGSSDKNPELDTEHEPRALAVLKKQLPESERSVDYKFHALRLTIHGDARIDSMYVRQESKRWRAEFRRFLARCGLTLVEQNNMIETFAESMQNRIREIKDEEVGAIPLSQSLWGKK